MYQRPSETQEGPLPGMPQRPREALPCQRQGVSAGSRHLPRTSDDTMARIYLKRTLTGFVPADEASAAHCKRFKQGHAYRADVVKPRNYKHHKQCMALLNLTFENLPEKYAQTYPTFDMFRYAVALESGHAEAFVTLQ